MNNIPTADKFPKTIEEVIIEPENTKYVSENSILYEKDTKKLIMCYSKDTNINIQDGINILGEYSFLQSTNAKIITLPDSVISILDKAFYTEVKYEKIKIGKNVSYIHPLFKYMIFFGIVEIDKNNNYYTIENNILYWYTWKCN